MNMHYFLIFLFSNVLSSTFCGPPWLFLFQNTRWIWKHSVSMKHLLLLLKICADRFYSTSSLKLPYSQGHYVINPLPANTTGGNLSEWKLSYWNWIRILRMLICVLYIYIYNTYIVFINMLYICYMSFTYIVYTYKHTETHIHSIVM